MGVPGQVAIPPALTADAVEVTLQALVKALSDVADAWANHKAALAAARAEVHASALADLEAVQAANSIPRSSDSDLP